MNTPMTFLIAETEMTGLLFLTARGQFSNNVILLILNELVLIKDVSLTVKIASLNRTFGILDGYHTFNRKHAIFSSKTMQHICHACHFYHFTSVFNY